MNTIIQRFLIVSVFISGTITAQLPSEEKVASQQIPATKPPDITSLEIGWWGYFDVKEAELPNRIEKFNAYLNTLPDQLPAVDRRTADGLIDKIELNLQAYEKSSKLPLPSKPTPGPIRKQYSLSEALKVNQTLRNQEIELRAAEKEKNEKASQIARSQEILNKLNRKYGNSDRRSEDKILLGLEIIALKSSIEVAKKNITFLSKQISVKKEQVRLLEEELQKALDRLASTDLDLINLSETIKKRRELWDTAKDALKTAQAKEAQALSESISGEEDENYKLLAQETDLQEIKETISHNQYVFSQIEFALAQVLLEPKNFDYLKLRKKIQSWKNLIAIFEERLPQWTTQAEREMQRAGQLLGADGSNASQELADLTQNEQEVIRLAQGNLLAVQRLRNDLADTRFMLTELENRVSAKIGSGEKWLQTIWEWFRSLYKQTLNWVEKELFSIGYTPITIASILQFVIIILITLWFARFVSRGITTVAKNRQGMKKSLIYRLQRLINYFLIALGVVIALTAIGFDFSNFIIIAGALGVGIGFGLQSIFNNFISGLIILFESQLKVGDYVQLESGMRGEIREINFRNTVITDNDGIDVLVPNSEMINTKILNWTLKVPYRRIHVPYSIAYGSDKDLAAKAVVEAAKAVPHTLNKIGVPEPFVRLLKLGDNGIEFDLVVWVREKHSKRLNTTTSDYLWAVETALREHNITIPFPQRDIHLIKQEDHTNRSF